MREHVIRGFIVVDDQCLTSPRPSFPWLVAAPLVDDDRYALVPLGADPAALVESGQPGWAPPAGATIAAWGVESWRHQAGLAVSDRPAIEAGKVGAICRVLGSRS